MLEFSLPFACGGDSGVGGYGLRAGEFDGF